VALVDARAPPALLLHGTADTAVDPRHTQRLRDRFAAAGVPVQVRLYPDTGHRMLVGALASPLRFLLPVRDDIADWLRAEGLDRRCADNMTQSPRPQRDGDNHERDRDQAVAPLVHHPDPTR
jgi:dienelactone hydrolase